MVDRYAELYRSYRWSVPQRYNIAQACCGQWAAERSRFALYWEDESGATAAYSFWDIQIAANRLSNALAALGVQRGDRVALMLPQRPETAIAYLAIFQLGAIALPLSHLFGPDAIEYRMNHAEASVALVEPTTIANLWAVKERLPSLRHVIGVGGARETGVHAWEALITKASRSFRAADTRADDPAVIIYTSGTTGAPKGALQAHRLIIGNISGFMHSHDFFPQPGDMFWSPADWAWAGGLFDALLPAWYYGVPILGYRGRFDAEKAYYLLDKYGVRNAFLFPTALKLMMKAVPEPRRKYELSLRSIKSAGECIGPAEIENCLVKHRAVMNAAVIGKPDETRGAIVKAYIVLQPGETPSPALVEDIQSHVRGRLAPYEYPREIEFIDALPMTTTGKVQRKELRKREEAKRRST